jgi:tRNA pseudouridine32 synthase/23S rRNA pseudouridine746 synthase/23S rRNA pseudouridine1911/1915/1917 synthase
MNTDISSEDLRARILHQDYNLLILDKPAGLAVHAGPQTPIHLEDMLEALCLGKPQRPRLAHRLDRDTAGCLLLARHDKALIRLNKLFTAGAIKKTYWAVVSGCPAEDSGQIDMALTKVSTKEDGWRMIADPVAGRAAVTDWRVLGRGTGITWLELSPQTGRTHQIRVHCASGLGCPIIGDPVYGPTPTRPLHLLARAISVPYWVERPPVTAEAQPPAHMLDALRVCGWSNS